MEKSFFICPVCRTGLFKTEKTYICQNGHSFDIAKKGYVNLLMSQKGTQHGDDKTMIASRTDFLNRGFYNPLSEKICECINRHCKENTIILDAGCGECKYTADIFESLKGKNPTVIGVDISKEALGFANRRTNKLNLAVASCADIPVEDGSADVLVNIFAPFMPEEFKRVIKRDGIIIRVYPLAKHLWELKELIYDVPYENPETDMEEEGLTLVEKLDVKYDMEFKTNEDIMSLFKMTPYFYRTSEEDKKKLEEVKSLTCRAEFGIAIYKKNDHR
ncbi:MAG: methyltransferase domain-containing protein [Ruminococcaceae bacterium]|nr:methyltransferase domain-containing protein [Oscillospiraceae bacterium]